MRARSRSSCAMVGSICAICALAPATAPRYWATCDSSRRLSIWPNTCPRRSRSAGVSERESNSPVTLLDTFTVSRACRWPAAVTVRVTAPRLATEVVTSAGGGGCGRRPCTVANATSATTSPARIQRPLVISSTLCAAQGRFRFSSVHQRSHHAQLRLRQLQLGVAHFQLRAHAHFLPRARQPQAFPPRLLRLMGHPHLRPRRRELGDRLLHAAGHAPPPIAE